MENHERELLKSRALRESVLPQSPFSDPKDALEQWYEHIKWVELNFSAGSVTSSKNILKLTLANCVTKFGPEASVHNDKRFLSIWLKFASCSNTMGTVGIYQQMLSLGYCTLLPEFYIQWASELEHQGQNAAALDVLASGLAQEKMSAASRHIIQDAQNNLKLRMLRASKEMNTSVGNVDDENTMSVLGTLKTQAQKVGSGITAFTAFKPPPSAIRDAGPPLKSRENFPVPAAVKPAVNLLPSSVRKPKPPSTTEAPAALLPPPSTAANSSNASSLSISPRPTVQPTCQLLYVDEDNFTPSDSKSYSFEEVRAKAWFAKQNSKHNEKRVCFSTASPQTFDLTQQTVQSTPGSMISNNQSTVFSSQHEEEADGTVANDEHDLNATIGSDLGVSLSDLEDKELSQTDTASSAKSEPENTPKLSGGSSSSEPQTPSDADATGVSAHAGLRDFVIENSQSPPSSISAVTNSSPSVSSFIVSETPKSNINNSSAIESVLHSSLEVIDYASNVCASLVMEEPFDDNFMEQDDDVSHQDSGDTKAAISLDSEEILEDLPETDESLEQTMLKLHLSGETPFRTLRKSAVGLDQSDECIGEVEEPTFLGCSPPTADCSQLVMPAQQLVFDFTTLEKTPQECLLQDIRAHVDSSARRERSVLVSFLCSPAVSSKCMPVAPLCTPDHVAAGKDIAMTSSRDILADLLGVPIERFGPEMLDVSEHEAIDLLQFLDESKILDNAETVEEIRQNLYTFEELQKSMLVGSEDEGLKAGTSDAHTTDLEGLDFGLIGLSTPKCEKPAVLLKTPGSSGGENILAYLLSTAKKAAKAPSNKDKTGTGLESKITSKINPFDLDTQQSLLISVWQDFQTYENFHLLTEPMPDVCANSRISLDGELCTIRQLWTETEFALIFDGHFRSQQCLVKVQRPANVWEFYAASETLRKTRNVDKAVIQIESAYFFTDGNVLVCPYERWINLGDLAGWARPEKFEFYELFCVFWLIELLRLFDGLHEAKLVHGGPPEINSLAGLFENTEFTLQCIDFSRTIDLSLLPQWTQFKGTAGPSESWCPEMRENREWANQIDYFGLASVVHQVLFGVPIKIYKTAATKFAWRIEETLSIKWNGPLWSEFFDTFLNIPDIDLCPSFAKMQAQFEEYFVQSLQGRLKYYNREIVKLQELLALHSPRNMVREAAAMSEEGPQNMTFGGLELPKFCSASKRLSPVKEDANNLSESHGVLTPPAAAGSLPKFSLSMSALLSPDAM